MNVVKTGLKCPSCDLILCMHLIPHNADFSMDIEAGDITICFACDTVLIFDAQATPLLPTEEQIIEILQRPGFDKLVEMHKRLGFFNN